MDEKCGSLLASFRSRSSFLANRKRISEILPWDRKSYLTQAILPRLSRDRNTRTMVVLDLMHMVVK